MVYTPIRKNPVPLVDAEAAIKSTPVRAGPTQGVQAKLKVNPMRRAVIGDMASASARNGRRCSCSNTWEAPNTPS